MKKFVQKVSEEALNKDFPITGNVPGWYFSQKEVSNGAWVVDGMDQWGRSVSRTGNDPDQLIKECQAAAQVINKQINDNSAHIQKCPFKVGEKVRFVPNERTKGLYQNIEKFGLTPGQVYEIKKIKAGLYLYFTEGGGWSFNEFEPISKE